MRTNILQKIKKIEKTLLLRDGKQEILCLKSLNRLIHKHLTLEYGEADAFLIL